VTEAAAPPTTAEEIKSCCAALYESDWARLLLGDSYHPGGLSLTRRIGELIELSSTDRVLDVAAGRGASVIEIARVFGCQVVGVDLSAANVAGAKAAAYEAGVAERAEFRVGDAERLPLDVASFDVILCECAFCTFPDKATGAAEFARVLRPGGRLGFSDVTRRGELPSELESLLAWIACITDARPAHDYVSLLEAAGFTDLVIEPRDDMLKKLVRDTRLKLLSVEIMAKLGKVDLAVADVREGKRIAKAAADAVAAGKLGYTVITGRRPA